MKSRRVIEHRDWSGGDWGRKQPWNAPINTFSATNMLLYRTGELGVRPGIADITPAGTAAGTVLDLLTAPQISDRSNISYVQGNQVFTFQPVTGSGFSASAGVFGASPTGDIYHYSKGRNAYFATSNSGEYQLPPSNVLTALATSPNARNITLYGDRLVVVESTSTARIRYNGLTAGVSDFTSWPAANIIPIGDSSPITAIIPQRGHLVIMKEYGGIFILTGQLGVNEVLRQASWAPGPETETGSGATEEDMIWYERHGVYSPANFDGTSVQYWNDMEYKVSLSKVVPFTTDGIEGVLYYGTPVGFSTSNGLLFHGGVWTKHEFGVLLAGRGAATDQTFYTNPFIADIPHLTTSFTIESGSGPGIVPHFYGWTPMFERPGSEFSGSDAAERAGDVSASQVVGRVEFPEVHLKDSDEFMVRGVVVDFRSWNTGGSLTNHFDLEVDCLRPYDDVSPHISLISAWDEAGSVSTVSGTIKRQVFSFGDQGVGNGYQLKFTNIRGIAFQRIQVIIETEQLRGL